MKRIRIVCIQSEADRQAILRQEQRTRRVKLYAVLRQGRKLYPKNASLRKKLVRAKLALGNTQPKCKVGLPNVHQKTMFARTTREANRREEFLPLAPRTMREAGLK